MFIEYSKSTHDLKVIIQKIKGAKVRNKVHKSTTLKKGKQEKVKPKEKSIKVKTKRKSPSKSKSQKEKVKKIPIKKETKTASTRSNKRVLVKKVSHDPNGRILRSGTAFGKNKRTVKEKGIPRTRSQKKRQATKRESSKHKLVKSIK